MAHLLRQPIVRFLVLGLALFVLHRLVAPAQRDERRIVVSAGFREGLREEHRRRAGREPTPAEEQGLVDRFVEEEVLYREALRLGLDRGDLIVRRRLLQKMEFLTRDATPLAEPGEEALEAHLARHREAYAEPERVSFRHVFLDRARRGAAVEADARQALGELARRPPSSRERGNPPAAPERLGDPFLQGSTWTRRSRAELSAVFGPAFADSLGASEVAAWRGPISSSYGLHLVQLSERVEGRNPPLAAVRERVQRGVLEERRAAADREAVRRLREAYVVEVEKVR